VSSSAKPSQIVVVPDAEVRKLSAAHIIKDELVRLGPKTSVSCKYSVVIKVIE
jgi:hypothetical protein